MYCTVHRPLGSCTDGCPRQAARMVKESHNAAVADLAGLVAVAKGAETGAVISDFHLTTARLGRRRGKLEGIFLALPLEAWDRMQAPSR